MFRKILVLTTLALLLAACGGGGGTATELNVEMTDLMFNPTDLEAAVGAVNVNLSNNGAVEHNFLVLKPDTTYTTAADIAPEDILFEAKLAAGESGQFTFNVDAVGEYPVVCTVPGHLEAGMVGKLVVK